MAKAPRGETVEMGFYFRDRGTADAFRDCVHAFFKMGAKVAGNTSFVQATEARGETFANTTAVSGMQNKQVDEKKLRELMSDADVSVRSVLLRNILTKTFGVSTEVTVESISPEASATDNHPVSIVAEGWILSTPGYENQAKKAGAVLYRKFTKICVELDPYYAAILHEDSLLCLHDLCSRRPWGMFCNFYLGSEVQAADEVKKLFADAYVEEIGKGCYISAYGLYNPKKKYLGHEAGIKKSAQTIDLLCGKEELKQ